MNQTSYGREGVYSEHKDARGPSKLYCNLLKAALVWASRHGCILCQTYNAYEVPRLTYKLLKRYNYRCPYTSNVSNYNRYLHDLLQLVGEEFNDTAFFG